VCIFNLHQPLPRSAFTGVTEERGREDWRFEACCIVSIVSASLFLSRAYPSVQVCVSDGCLLWRATTLARKTEAASIPGCLISIALCQRSL